MTNPKVPPGAIDAHVHIFERGRFPFQENTPYAPLPQECGSAAHLLSVLDAHGLGGALLVNPTSGYGLDNACMLDALVRYPDRFRGIARVPLNVTRQALKALAAKGVAGIRIDLVGEAGSQLTDPDFESLLHMLTDLDLVLQVQCEKEQPLALAAALKSTPVRTVVDHCGRPDATGGVRQPGFRALLKLAESGHVAVKLSGAFRYSQRAAPYPDADRYVKALLGAFGPTRCMWGSDWPFLRMLNRVDYGPILALLERWIPDPRIRRQVMADTPRRWFGFTR